MGHGAKISDKRDVETQVTLGYTGLHKLSQEASPSASFGHHI